MKYHIVPVTVFNQNCSIIWCEITNEAMLVDPGGEKEKLCREIDKLNVRITKIVLTHGHIDHVGSAVELKKYYGVPIFGPNDKDRFLLDNLSFQCYLFNLDEPYCSQIKPDVWLKNGDLIRIGQEVFDVLHCPGHSPGHVVFWNRLHKFIIMGDVLFKGSVGRTDLPGGNNLALIKSIKAKLFPLGDDITFLPGHGCISTIGYERMYNPILI